VWVDGRGADGVAGNRVVSLLAGRVDGMFDDNMDGTPKPPPPQCAGVEQLPLSTYRRGRDYVPPSADSLSHGFLSLIIYIEILDVFAAGRLE
jgi:hypothetical protein